MGFMGFDTMKRACRSDTMGAASDLTGSLIDVTRGTGPEATNGGLAPGEDSNHLLHAIVPMSPMFREPLQESEGLLCFTPQVSAPLRPRSVIEFQ